MPSIFGIRNVDTTSTKVNGKVILNIYEKADFVFLMKMYFGYKLHNAAETSQ